MSAETMGFDTSGYIHGVVHNGARQTFGWSDLPNDFVRGYIRAAFAEMAPQTAPEHHYDPDWGMLVLPPLTFGFSDLHPDTLVSMLADCARFRPVEGSEPDDVKRVKGGMFWRYRQDGAYAADGFPPIRLSLDPNGKVVANPTGGK